MTSLYCHGLGTDGPCDCLKFVLVPDQSPKAPHLCRDCGHKQSSHKDPTLTTIQLLSQSNSSGASRSRIQEILLSIKGMKHADSNSLSSTQTTFSAASKEANSGFRPAVASSSKDCMRRSTLGSFRGGKPNTNPSRSFRVGEVVLCVDGIAVSALSFMPCLYTNNALMRMDA